MFFFSFSKKAHKGKEKRVNTKNKKRVWEINVDQNIFYCRL